MKARNFDKKFDDNKQDVMNDLDLSTIKRPNQKQKRTNAEQNAPPDRFHVKQGGIYG